MLHLAGLTSRPDVRGQPASDDPLRNPYTVQAQAKLALQLATQLGVRQVVLAGHTDGALVALEAAASACRWGGPAFPTLRNLDLAVCCNPAATLRNVHLKAGTGLATLHLARACTEDALKGGGCGRYSAATCWAVFVAWRRSVHSAELLCMNGTTGVPGESACSFSHRGGQVLALVHKAAGIL